MRNDKEIKKIARAVVHKIDMDKIDKIWKDPKKARNAGLFVGFVAILAVMFGGMAIIKGEVYYELFQEQKEETIKLLDVKEQLEQKIERLKQIQSNDWNDYQDARDLHLNTLKALDCNALRSVMLSDEYESYHYELQTPFLAKCS